MPWVILDGLERLYIAGFVLLQAFVTLFPLLTRSPATGATSEIIPECLEGGECPQNDPAEAGSAALEFLPLMLTSVYCAIGLVWAFVRLSVIYLRQP